MFSADASTLGQRGPDRCERMDAFERIETEEGRPPVWLEQVFIGWAMREELEEAEELQVDQLDLGYI